MICEQGSKYDIFVIIDKMAKCLLKSKIERALTFLEDNSESELTDDLLAEASHEVGILENLQVPVNDSFEYALKDLQEFILLLKNKRIQEARKKIGHVKAGFTGHLKCELIIYLEKAEENSALPPRPSINSTFEQSTKQIQDEHEDENCDNELSQLKPSTKQEINASNIEDFLRPTMIAEKFTGIFDNEWADAFDELTKKNIIERQITNYLLKVVQEAYTLSKETADRQIDELAVVFRKIIAFGPREYQSQTILNLRELPPNDRSLLIHIRKDNASKALTKLKEGFKNLMSQMNKAESLPASPKALTNYAGKVLELTWWMCVQDPPVCMVPMESRAQCDGNLFRPYTKTGSTLDFIVWPALKLHKDGAVIVKGVAQYR